MKKSLLVLLVVALASLLLVGCMPPPTTPAEGEGEGEAEICPTVAISSQVVLAGKNYIKAGTQTITVTFAVPTEPVSVWVPDDCNEKDAPDGVPSGATELVMYPNADKTVYTGDFDFADSKCCEFFVYVLTCNTCAPCKVPFIVDGEGPNSEIEITSTACTCEGCKLIFKTPAQSEVCDVTDICCGDYCSGFASYSLDLYTSDPFNSCCDPSLCEEPIATGSGIDCPIDFTTGCLEAGTYYAVIRLVDNVGLEQNYYAKIEVTGGMTIVENLCLPETVRIRLTIPSADSYFNTTVNDSPSEYDYLNDAFNGWCADDYTYISVDTDYDTTYIYSSLDKVNPPDCILSRPWGSVNWLLNNWTTFTPPNSPLTWQDVQVTIWQLIHVGLSPELCILENCVSVGSSLGPNAANVLSLYTAAYAHSDYIPSSDELVAVILLVNNVCPDGDDNTGNNAPNSKQMTFFGVPKNELYCESETIDLPYNITVSEGFEVSAPTCITWTETDNTIGTCGAIYLSGATQVIVEP